MVLQRIEKAEAKKACCQLLCKCLSKPLTRGGITRIEVADHKGAACIVMEPNKFFDLTLKRNHAHFSQATSTPFTKPPLSKKL
jgi:hypothetical protein